MVDLLVFQEWNFNFEERLNMVETFYDSINESVIIYDLNESLEVLRQIKVELKDKNLSFEKYDQRIEKQFQEISLEILKMIRTGSTLKWTCSKFLEYKRIL